MHKMLYCGAILLLFVVVTLGMWFFPIGRDLEADNEYLRQSPVPNSAQAH